MDHCPDPPLALSLTPRTAHRPPPAEPRTPLAAPLAAAAEETIRRWALDDDGVSRLQLGIGRALAASADSARPEPGCSAPAARSGGGGGGLGLGLASEAEAGVGTGVGTRIGLAHGAAGMIHALETASLEIDGGALEWFSGATARALARPNSPIGLYSGLAGAGWVHRRLGNDELAEQVLHRVRAARSDGLTGAGISDGLAGIGLYFLAEVSRDPRCLGFAADIAARLDAGLGAAGATGAAEDPGLGAGRGAGLAATGAVSGLGPRGPVGLLHGPSGIALFAARLFAVTGDRAHLSLARRAVQLDLARCVVDADGSLRVGGGDSDPAGLSTGAAGIGLALAQIVPHLGDPEPGLSLIEGIARTAADTGVREAGLFAGRSGMIHLLVLLSRSGFPLSLHTERALRAQVEGLRGHAAPFGDGIAFPETAPRRWSSDLATGTAGVLTAITAYGMLVHDEERPGWEDLLPLLLPAAGERGVPALPRVRVGAMPRVR